jgi:hypothetical protein
MRLKREASSKSSMDNIKREGQSKIERTIQSRSDDQQDKA